MNCEVPRLCRALASAGYTTLMERESRTSGLVRAQDSGPLGRDDARCRRLCGFSLHAILFLEVSRGLQYDLAVVFVAQHDAISTYWVPASQRDQDSSGAIARL